MNSPISNLKLTCICGNSWVHAVTGPVPRDLRQICPVCTGKTEVTRVPPAPDTEHSIRVAASAEMIPATQSFGGDREAAARADETAASFVGIKPGTIFGGFEVLQEINRGGMGIIY